MRNCPNCKGFRLIGWANYMDLGYGWIFGMMAVHQASLDWL
jgi:hypothetical protein|tara:strand:+ start:5884 stop:6006 length:123 start_codon:yes stop_codon:yes gene_type:complete